MPRTVAEFCQRYKVSKVHYYALKKRGDGPDELHLGRRRIITDDAEREWARRMSQSERQKAIDPVLATAAPVAPELSAREDALVDEIETLRSNLSKRDRMIEQLQRKLQRANAVIAARTSHRLTAPACVAVGSQPESAAHTRTTKRDRLLSGALPADLVEDYASPQPKRTKPHPKASKRKPRPTEAEPTARVDV